MFSGSLCKRPRSKFVPRVLSVAMVTFVLAMMVLPLTTPSGVNAADNNDNSQIELNGNGNLLDVDLTDDEGDDDSELLDVPNDVDLLPDLPIVDLPDCVDTDGGETIYLPGGFEVIDDQTIQLPDGLPSDFMQESPSVVDLIGDLLGTPGVTVVFPAGVEIDFDNGIIYVPECGGGDEPGYVTVHKYGCMATVSFANPDLDTLRDACGALSDVTFSLHNSNGNIESDEDQVTDVDGLAMWFVDQPDQLTIGESIPDGYTDSIVVFCGIIQGTGQFPQTLSQVDATGAVVYYDLEAGEQLYCDWFNKAEFIDIDVPVGNGIVIYKHACIEDFDVYNSDADGVAAACQDYMDGVTFNVTDGGPTNLSGTSGADGEGKVVFDGLDAGEYFISEEIPAGYGEPVVYCAMGDSFYQYPNVEFGRMDLENDGSVFSVLATNDVLYCHFFNVPLETSSIYITKHLCPAGVAQMADYGQLVADCPDRGAGIPFGYSGGGNWTWDQTDQAGMVVFNGFEPYGYWIGEEKQAGYGLPIVLCTSKYEAGDPVNWVAQQVTDEFGRYDIYYGFNAGEMVFCDWFNFPTDGATVVIYKHACIDGFDAYHADPDGLAANCSELLDDVTFTVEELGAASVSGDTGADGPGKVIFGGLDSGEYIVTEEVPQGYGEPIVYCKLVGAGDPEPGDLDPMDFYADATIFSVITGDDVLYCHWFNVPTAFEDTEDDGSVVVNKFDCPVAENSDDYYDEQWIGENCGTMDGVDFVLSWGIDTILSATTGQDGPGQIVWSDLPAVKVAIGEDIPAGYGTPIVYCFSQMPGDAVPSPLGTFEVTDATIRYELKDGEVLYCTWINVPYEDDGEVVIYKFDCPYLPDLSGFNYQGVPDGCERMPGVEFTLSYGIDTILTDVTSDPEGTVAWGDLPAVTVSISEQLPDGYGDPVVTCLSVYQTEDGPVENVYDPTMTGSSFAYNLKDGEKLYCFWLNIPYEDGSITIVKYVCPAGYDLYAQGADPKWDCQDKANGIAFTLNGPSYDGATADTGTSGPGKLSWGDLSQGDYTVSEHVPSGTDYVFVLSCESERAKWIQGYPLVYGSQIDIPLLSGDHVTCYFYNVPDEPDYGTITVIKYVCPTATFKDADDCERYEDGVSFHLSAWTGSGWVEAAQGTTNSNGVLSWYGLEPGTYEIDEVGGTWCYASADRTDNQGNLIVKAGEETTVWVYNCGQKVVTKKPKKFPNTGVGQTAVAPTGANAPVVPAPTGPVLDPTQWMGVLDSRLIAPFLSAGKPVSIEIEKIGVDARIETLEVIDGALQDPTTADKVAWYKDSAKLDDEKGNVVMAGHLNYWGVPEGVFYGLNSLEKGDVIVVTAQDGTVYRYRVNWVKQIDAFDGDVTTLAGETKKPSLTLITCGGQWNDAAQEYDHRTVVRATLIEDKA